MVKTKTSKKREFCLDDIPVRQLKKGVKTIPFKASEELKNPKFIAEVLTQCLLDGDVDSFKEVLSAHLSVVKKDSFYKKAGVSRRTLFRMLSPDGNPTLDSIARVVSTLAHSSASLNF